MEKVLDGLAVLFPFELDCYRDVDVPVSFVGHPFARPDYLSPISYEPSGPVALLPGSRVQPVQRILPCFLDAFDIMLRRFPDIHGVIPVPDSKIRTLVEELLANRRESRDRLSVQDCQSRFEARAALMSSGTMSLACAIAGIPGVVAYRAHPLTYLLGRFLVNVPYLGMANLLLPEKPPYEEFLQGEANGNRLAIAMDPFLEAEGKRDQFEESASLLSKSLAQRGSCGLADWLIKEGCLLD